jgi:hypothetical protein
MDHMRRTPSSHPVTAKFLEPGYGCHVNAVTRLSWASYHLHKRPLTELQTRSLFVETVVVFSDAVLDVEVTMRRPHAR